MAKKATPAEKSLQAKLAVHTSWEGKSAAERAERTAAARAKFEERFKDEHARKAYFAGLALKSAQARRRRAAEL